MAKKPTLTPEEARQEALKTALETIERKFGQGAVMKLSDDVHVKVPVIPTGLSLIHISEPTRRS